MKSALVVDDDRQVSALLERWLTNTGHTVTTINGFEDAKRRILEGEELSLLIVDVRLEGFNGIHLAILGRQRWPDLRIVVLSGWDDPVLRQEASSCGATYLCKPVTAEDLQHATS